MSFFAVSAPSKRTRTRLPQVFGAVRVLADSCDGESLLWWVVPQNLNRRQIGGLRGRAPFRLSFVAGVFRWSDSEIYRSP